jgi:hypothetical protein
MHTDGLTHFSWDDNNVFDVQFQCNSLSWCRLCLFVCLLVLHYIYSSNILFNPTPTVFYLYILCNAMLYWAYHLDFLSILANNWLINPLIMYHWQRQNKKYTRSHFTKPFLINKMSNNIYKLHTKCDRVYFLFWRCQWYFIKGLISQLLARMERKSR